MTAEWQGKVGKFIYSTNDRSVKVKLSFFIHKININLIKVFPQTFHSRAFSMIYCLLWFSLFLWFPYYHISVKEKDGYHREIFVSHEENVKNILQVFVLHKLLLKFNSWFHVMTSSSIISRRYHIRWWKLLVSGDGGSDGNQ